MAAVCYMQVCLVFVAVASVIVYRIIMTIDYCVLTSPAGCLILTSVLSAVLNAAAILILGKVSTPPHSLTISPPPPLYYYYYYYYYQVELGKLLAYM